MLSFNPVFLHSSCLLASCTLPWQNRQSSSWTACPPGKAVRPVPNFPPASYPFGGALKQPPESAAVLLRNKSTGAESPGPAWHWLSHGESPPHTADICRYHGEEQPRRPHPFSHPSPVPDNEYMQYGPHQENVSCYDGRILCLFPKVLSFPAPGGNGDETESDLPGSLFHHLQNHPLHLRVFFYRASCGITHGLTARFLDSAHSHTHMLCLYDNHHALWIQMLPESICNLSS